ncbi:hypothetical protein [Aurantivibrio plasticivorans]
MKLASFLCTLILASSALVGCSSTGNETKVAKSDDDVICRMERVMGSNIKQKVCKTRKQRLEDQAGGTRILDTNN